MPDQQRAKESIPLQDQRSGNSNHIVVHYSVPAGSTFLPIFIDETVTMIQVGVQHCLSADGSRVGTEPVFEPINTFLKSPEDGLRFCRSMDTRDVIEDPLQLLPWGTQVHGGLSDDSRWMVNPTKVGENPAIPIPDNSDTEQFDIASPAADINISLLVT